LIFIKIFKRINTYFKEMTDRKNKVAIIHPDLGIGGAEQLIINLALAL
jgi:hypothetical protein